MTKKQRNALYYQNNKECLIKINNLWKKNHPGWVKIYNAKWYKKNKVKKILISEMLLILKKYIITKQPSTEGKENRFDRGLPRAADNGSSWPRIFFDG